MSHYLGRNRIFEKQVNVEKYLNPQKKKKVSEYDA